MPTAGADNVDDIVQFVGTTDSTYTNGHFYKCVSDGQDPATYSWEEVSLGGSSLPDQTGQSGKYLTTNGTNASWGTVNALKNSASNTTSISIRQTSGTQAVGSNCVTIGDTNTYTDDESVAIGYKAKIGNSYATSIGTQSTAWSPETVAIGYKANAWGYYGVSVGSETHAEGGCVALGYKSEAIASNVAIGTGLNNSGRGSICIGHWTGATPQVTNTEYGCFKVYLAQDSTGNTVAEYKILDPDGTIPEARLADTTNAQEGDALTLDSSGNAVWTNPLQYVLGGLQTTDSSKVGYLQYYFEENNAVNAPAGGKWLVLDCLKVNTSNGLTYVFSADFTSPVGSIVAGGTQIAAARTGYTTRALLLKVE